MGYALYLTDARWAQLFLWTGMAVGYGGMSYALLSAYRRGEERGDW